MILRNLTIPSSQINNPAMDVFKALTNGLGPVASGVTVNHDTAMRYVAVYSAIRLIAETIAALPLHTFERHDGARVEVRDPSERFIWDAPNPEMTQMEFWEIVIGHCLATGNAFLYTPRNQMGAIAELWPVRPDRVLVGRASTGEKVYEVDGQPATSREITHVPAFGSDGLRGLSPIGVARQAIGLGLAADEFAANFFGQGSTLSGVIKTEADLTPEQADKLLALWNKRHQGVNNAFKTAVLDNGASWQDVGIPPEDAQLLETRKFQITEIARLYRIPPHMIGDVEKSTSWGTGIEQQNIQMVTFTLRSWIVRFEQAITKRLIAGNQDRFAKWNVDGLLRGDMRSRVIYYSAGRRDGWLSANDIRAKEEMEPIEGGDEYTVQMNTTPIEALGEEKESDDGGDQTA